MRNEPQVSTHKRGEHDDVLADAAVVGVLVAIVADFLVCRSRSDMAESPASVDGRSRLTIYDRLTTLEQIQQREQENPHQIDEVPIQADVFDEVGLACDRA